MSNKGILLLNKEEGFTSFSLVSLLRRITKIEKIGHAGTLDPFATGVMVMLIGKEYTRRSEEFLSSEKEYRASLQFGVSTNTYDLDGEVVFRSEKIPTELEVERAIHTFSGEIDQIPPMYSAKKVGGKKLCDLARQGIEIERKPSRVRVAMQLIRYLYPILEIDVCCSKGTYIRSLAHDIGQFLGCGAHLRALSRTRSGSFLLKDCISQKSLNETNWDLSLHLRQG